MTSVWWIRRDIRLADNGAVAAASADGPVVPLFVVDPKFLEHSGLPRLTFMFDSLRELNARMKDSLVVRVGDPATEVAAVAREVDAPTVYAHEDFGVYGRARDSRVATSLRNDGRTLRHVDSPYAVNPGTVRKDDGTPLKVFTPFYKRWQLESWTSYSSTGAKFVDARALSQQFPALPECDAQLPVIGEDAAWARWQEWSSAMLDSYKDDRDKPGVDGTSKLSTYLRWGVLHPRQLLADLPGTRGGDHYRSELCWREFYADVLFHNPDSMWNNLQKKMDVLPVDTDARARTRFDAWCAGRTGYPIVDAGMREMLATGYMHNRVRMIVASFLVKDLHVPWQWGARFFMKHLVDGDTASNNHGWQWTAGTGTDAAPYFRVFNPFGQSEKFDPDGTYIRRWVPELASLESKHIHTPWELGLLAPSDYPQRIVDHAVEREEALARYKKVSGK